MAGCIKYTALWRSFLSERKQQNMAKDRLNKVLVGRWFDMSFYVYAATGSFN